MNQINSLYKNTSLIGKRNSQTINSSRKDQVHKKLKVDFAEKSSSSTDLFNKSSNHLFSVRDQNIVPSQSFTKESNLVMVDTLSRDLEPAGDYPDLHLLLKAGGRSVFEQEHSHLSHPDESESFKIEEDYSLDAVIKEEAEDSSGSLEVKQEFVKKEEFLSEENCTLSGPIEMNESDCKKETADSASEEIGEKKVRKPLRPKRKVTKMPEKPALTELTKLFPNWELTTIFNYINSGKTRASFNPEQQAKKINKLVNRKKRLQKQNLTKSKLRPSKNNKKKRGRPRKNK